MAQNQPKLVQNLHFWSFWAKYCHFLHILSNARPKIYVNKVPGWVFRYMGYKTFDFSSKKKVFLPKNDQIWPKISIFGHFGPGHAGLFGALLVGRLVVVARGLYLARHLFTLLQCSGWSYHDSIIRQTYAQSLKSATLLPYEFVNNSSSSPF